MVFVSVPKLEGSDPAASDPDALANRVPLRFAGLWRFEVAAEVSAQVVSVAANA